jgi:hypothetical protein
MGDLSFFGVLRLRLAQTAAPNSAQDDRPFQGSTPERNFAPASWLAGSLRDGQLRGGGDAFYDDAFGFEVGDAMVGAVTHHDRLFQKSDERAGGFREPAVVGLIPIDGEIVGGVAFGAGERGVEPALEGAGGELANGF